MKIPQYQSLKEKENVFGDRYMRITKKEQLIDWHTKYDIDAREKSPYLFRGVNNARYKNYTSVQRFLLEHNDIDVALQDLIEIHLKSLKQSKSAILRAYCISTGVSLTDLYLLSFSQHYGGISPLLDFTESVNTSLFFMIQGHQKVIEDKCDQIENYVSVYFVNTQNTKFYKTLSELSDEIMHQYPYGLKEDASNASKEIELKKILNNRLSYDSLRKEWSNGMYLIVKNLQHAELINNEHFFLKMIVANLNAVAQSGVFVYNERGMNPLEQDLYCVDIHKALIPYIHKNFLSSNRYSYTLLFPTPKAIVKEAQQFTLCKTKKPQFVNKYPLNECSLDEIMNMQHISR